MWDTQKSETFFIHATLHLDSVGHVRQLQHASSAEAIVHTCAHLAIQGNLRCHPPRESSLKDKGHNNYNTSAVSNTYRAQVPQSKWPHRVKEGIVN